MAFCDGVHLFVGPWTEHRASYGLVGIADAYRWLDDEQMAVVLEVRRDRPWLVVNLIGQEVPDPTDDAAGCVVEAL